MGWLTQSRLTAEQSGDATLRRFAGELVPSNAFDVHLRQLLLDAEELDDDHATLRTGTPGRQFGLAALNRAAVVMCVSAWEAYVEELIRESVEALRPVPPSTGTWPSLNAYASGAIGRFNTPNAANVERLIRDCIGVPSVTASWSWQNTTPDQAKQRLDDALDLRHQIAHGVNPRPTVHNFYSSQLPQFIRKLSRCTDAAVRSHLVTAYGLSTPWPS